MALNWSSSIPWQPRRFSITCLFDIREAFSTHSPLKPFVCFLPFIYEMLSGHNVKHFKKQKCEALNHMSTMVES